MPSTKYTRIEITQDAYAGLEAEAIIQRKTLKKLASDIILNGISKKALNFVQDSVAIENNKKITKEIIEKVKMDIGATNLNDALLDKIKKILLDEGYQGAMLYVAQNTASFPRDELFRVLTVFQLRKIPSALAVDLIDELNR